MKLEITKNSEVKVFYTLEWFDNGVSVRKISLYEESYKALEEYFRPKKVRKLRMPAPPPTLEEVKAYFKEKGYIEDAAIRFHKYYTELNWFDANSKPVLNWKAKSISTWFKVENQIKKEEVKTNKPSFFQS